MEFWNEINLYHLGENELTQIIAAGISYNPFFIELKSIWEDRRTTEDYWTDDDGNKEKDGDMGKRCCTQSKCE